MYTDSQPEEGSAKFRRFRTRIICSVRSAQGAAGSVSLAWQATTLTTPRTAPFGTAFHAQVSASWKAKLLASRKEKKDLLLKCVAFAEKNLPPTCRCAAEA